MIGGAKVKGFAGFGDGDNEGTFPDGGEVGVGDGEVEEGAEEGDAFGAQLPEMKVRQAVGTGGRRILDSTDCIGNIFLRERGVRVVEGELADFPK